MAGGEQKQQTVSVGHRVGKARHAEGHVGCAAHRGCALPRAQHPSKPFPTTTTLGEASKKKQTKPQTCSIYPPLLEKFLDLTEGDVAEKSFCAFAPNLPLAEGWESCLGALLAPAALPATFVACH